MRPFIKYHRLALLCGFVLFYGAWGCEEKAQAPPPQPKVVAQKITPAAPPKAPAPAATKTAAPAPPQPATPQPPAADTAAPQPAAPTAQAPATDAPTAEAKTEAEPTATAPAADAPAPPAPAGAPSLPASMGYSADAVTQQVKIDVKSTMANLTEKVAVDGSSLYRARFYNPEGKIDPFAPVFQQSSREEAATTGTKQPRKKRVPQTPLERIGLAQLDLVGIIRMPSGNRAIVQEVSGKGYVVKKGTYIGTNAGRVIDIEPDRVVIEEEVENVLGDVTTRIQELKLKKPLGEE